MRKWLVLLLLFIVPAIANTNINTEITMVIEPRERFTSNWLFLIDNSDSMKNIFPKVRKTFEELTKFPTDEWSFKIILFSHQNILKETSWEIASVDEFSKTDKWILTEGQKHPRVNSYVSKALEAALTDEHNPLTIILISDGGFTEACYNRGYSNIYNLLDSYQEKRVKNSLTPAIICSIGIENINYSAGGKPNNDICQAAMRRIGSRWRGGYFYVREINNLNVNRQ